MSVSLRLKMHYPPESWDIKCEDMFGAYSLTDTTEELTARVLLQISREGKLQGSFKILLGGCEPVKLDVPAQEVLIMAGVASYRLCMEKWPRDIQLLTNSTTSTWFDLDER